MNQEALKAIVLGEFTKSYPESIPEVRARAEELKEELKQRLALWKTHEQKAVELMAYSLFVVDFPKVIEEVSK